MVDTVTQQKEMSPVGWTVLQAFFEVACASKGSSWWIIGILLRGYLDC